MYEKRKQAALEVEQVTARPVLVQIMYVRKALLHGPYWCQDQRQVLKCTDREAPKLYRTSRTCQLYHRQAGRGHKVYPAESQEGMLLQDATV